MMDIDEKQIQVVVKNLKRSFYFWFFVLIFFSVLSAIFGSAMDKLNPSLTISLQSLLLLALLGGIPGTLVWFRNRMKELSQIGDFNLRLARYERLARMRQSIFFMMELLVLFMQVFTIMKGALMLFFVVVLVSLFIAPSRGRLMMEAGFFKPEDEMEEEQDEDDLGSE
jgi:hypothetical protein